MAKGKSGQKTAKAVQKMLKSVGRDTATPVTIGPYKAKGKK